MSWDSPQSIEDQRNGDELLSAEDRGWIADFIKQAGSLVFHIETIEQSDDLELIEISIDAIQFLDDNMADFFGDEHRDIRIDIREGTGDFEKIQQKCIDLGVV